MERERGPGITLRVLLSHNLPLRFGRCFAPLASFALLLPSACSQPSVTPLVTELLVPPATKATQPDLPSLLVWTRTQGGSPIVQTRLISANGSLLVTRNEPVAETSHGLVAVRLVPDSIAICPCSECDVPTGCPAPTLQRRLVGRAVAQHLATPALVDLAEPLQDGHCDGPTDSEQRTMRVLALASTTAFVELEDSQMYCQAAHPTFSTFPVAVDLERGELLRFEPAASELAALATKAQEQIVEAADGCLSDSKETPAFFSLWPGFSKEGTANVQLAFTMGAPYACGTGPGHYSVQTEVVSSTVPESLKLPAIPSWALPVFAHEEVVGVGALLDAARTHEAVAELRSAALPPAFDE